MLFQRYPGDIHLQSYLKQAIQDGTLSLAAFVTTFLSAAPSLQDAAILDILCKTVLECHYVSGLPPNGSVVSFNDSPGTILRTVQNGVKLLHTACTLPASPYHQVPSSASELLILLLSTVADVSQISTTDAILFLDAANPLMQLPQLSEDVRHVLENFCLSLTYILGDDAKAAHEAQMMHTLQLALGKNDIVGSNADRDIITCSLLLQNLVGPLRNTLSALLTVVSGVPSCG